MKVIRHDLGIRDSQIIFQNSIKPPAKPPQVKGFERIKMHDLPARMNTGIRSPTEMDLRFPLRQPQENAKSFFQLLLHGTDTDLVLRPVETGAPVFNL